MSKKDFVYLAGIFVVSALLILNLFKPTAPHAYTLPQGSGSSVPVDISASGDSAWAIIGDKVYYLSMRSRSELPSGQTRINVIDSKNLD